MKLSIIIAFTSFIVSLILGFFYIKIFLKLKIGQPILKYVSLHKIKSGTPTMGGIFFIIPSIVVYYIFVGFSYKIVNVILIITLAFLLVGFLDDFIKLKYNNNEGLKPYQKIIFQFAISLFLGIFSYKNEITKFYIPFNLGIVDFGIYTIFIVVFTLIATTNCVNLTDGLDGLAGSTTFIYLLFILILIVIENNNQYGYLLDSPFIYVISSFLGGIFAFLVYNINKASVFMGDTGSLSLGSFLAVISIFSNNILFIPIIGFTFVLSGLSVIIQVVHYKRTKKKVFLMAPFHHHLEKKGYRESKIVFIYSVITVLLGGLSIIFYI